MSAPKTYRLLGPDGPYDSPQKAVLGGNRPAKIYGRLDCPSALRALARSSTAANGYASRRVFFLDEATARQCGYRPCGVCLRKGYAAWKAARSK